MEAVAATCREVDLSWVDLLCSHKNLHGEMPDLAECIGVMARIREGACEVTLNLRDQLIGEYSELV